MVFKYVFLAHGGQFNFLKLALGSGGRKQGLPSIRGVLKIEDVLIPKECRYKALVPNYRLLNPDL